MNLFKLLFLICSLLFLLFALGDAKGKGGGRSSFSSKSKSSKSSSSGSSSSGSGSSYPKQQWSSGGSQPTYGQPSHNYGQPSGGGYNYGQPSGGGMNYGQPSGGGINYGQPSGGGINYGRPGGGGVNYGQPGGGGVNYGQPGGGGINYGQPGGGGINYGQPGGGGMNYGQPGGGGINYGQPNVGFVSNPKSHKSSSAKTAVVGAAVGAAVGAYATHKVHTSLDKGHHLFKPRGPNIVVVGSRPTRRPPLKIKYIYLATVSRSEWNATRLSELNIRPGDSFSKVIVHHTNSPDCYNLTDCMLILKAVEQRNMLTKKLDNIGYNFMIGGDGRIYENFAWTMFSKIINRPSIDPISLQVAFIGDFSVYPPNQRQMDAFEALLEYGDKKDFLKKYRIHGHKDLTCTTCPGNVLYALIKNMERYQPLLDPAELCNDLRTLSEGGSAILLPSLNTSAAVPPSKPLTFQPPMPPVLPPGVPSPFQPAFIPAVPPELPTAFPPAVLPELPHSFQPALTSGSGTSSNTHNITALLSDDENFKLLFN